MSGLKVYLLAAAAVVYAAIGWLVMPMIDPTHALALGDAVKIAFAGLALAVLRGAVATEINNILVALGIETEAQRRLAAIGAQVRRAGDKAVDGAKRSAGSLFAVAIGLTLLTGAFTMSGCAVFSNPSTDLATVEAALGAADAGYAALCATSPGASFCSSAAQSKERAAVKLASDAIVTAQEAIASGQPVGAVEALIAHAQQLEADVEDILRTAKAKAAALHKG